MDITILPMPTGLMLTRGTSNCEVEFCNFDNLFFNQNELWQPYVNKFCCSLKIRILYKFLRRRVLIGLALTS